MTEESKSEVNKDVLKALEKAEESFKQRIDKLENKIDELISDSALNTGLILLFGCTTLYLVYDAHLQITFDNNTLKKSMSSLFDICYWEK